MATYYFRTGGGNTSLASNWSLSSGGPADGAVPTQTDNAIFDANSGNATVNATLQCASIDFTGYATVITMTSGIESFGAITLSAAMTITGTGSLTVESLAATLTSNGKTWPNAFVFGTNSASAHVYTLADDWTISGDIAFGNGFTASNQINGNRIFAGAGMTSSGTGPVFTGTTDVILNGTGTISYGGNSQFGLDLEINTAGTITITGTFNYRTGTFLYTAGTVVTSGSTLVAINSGTWNLNGITWNNVVLANTITLGSNLTIGGATTFNGSTPTVNGAFNVNIGGNITVTGTVSGTSTFVFNGTGTWSGSGTLGLNTTINTSGTVTVSGTVNFGASGGVTLTYTAGTVVTTGSTLRMANVATLNTNGISWNDFTIVTGGPITLSSNLTCINYDYSNTSCAVNGNTIIISGNATSTASSTNGTTSLKMVGTGNITGSYHANIEIDTSGTITITGTLAHRGTKSLTLTNGTFTGAVSSTLLSGGDTTWNIPGATPYNVTLQHNGTLTLSSALVVANDFTVGAGTLPTSNGNSITFGGSLVASGISLSGTTTLIMNGTGTWSGSAIIKTPLTFNTSGTVTISGTVNYSTGTMTWTAGTVSASSATLAVPANATFNTGSNVVFGTLTLGTNNTTTVLTLTSDLYCSGTASVNGSSSTTTVTVNTSKLITGAVSLPNVGRYNGTGTIRLTSGTSIFSGTSATVDCNIEFAGDISLTGNVNFGGTASTTMSITWVSGYTTTSGATTVGLGSTSCNITILSGSTIWEPTTSMTISASTTLTLSDNMHVVCNLGFGVTASPILNGNKLFAYKSVTSINNVGISGTTELHLAGTGTFTSTGSSNAFTLPVYINSPNGRITINTPRIGGRFEYVAGIVEVTPTTGIPVFTGSPTCVNIDSIRFTNGVTFASGTTLTCNKFFEGQGDKPCRVRPAAAGNMTVVLTEPHTSYFVSVENVLMSATSPYKLVVGTINGNKGGNSGVIFIDSAPRGNVSTDDWVKYNWPDNNNAYYNNWGQAPQGFPRNS